jgi:hypothetical protein
VSDVFIVGAGFSRVIPDQRPLLADLAELVAAGQDRADWQPWLRRLNDDIGHLMTMPGEFQPWDTEATNLEQRAMSLRFVERLAVILNERQTAAIDATGTCPVWLIRLVDAWNESRATVVTFNDDTLIEKAYTDRDTGARSDRAAVVLPHSTSRGTRRAGNRSN